MGFLGESQARLCERPGACLYQGGLNRRNFFKNKDSERGEDGSEIGGSRVHFPSTPVKHLTDLRNRANSQRYSSIYEYQRPKIEDTERSDGKKSA